MLMSVNIRHRGRVMRAIAFFAIVWAFPAPAAAEGSPPAAYAPVGYPAHCAKDAAPVETVRLEFSLSPQGKPERIQVLDSTNRCFDRPAIIYVSDWVYGPRTTHAPGVQPQTATVTLRFDRDGSTRTAGPSRTEKLRDELAAISHRLGNDGDPSEALRRLEEIENEYSGFLFSGELVAHRILTAIAYQAKGDIDGALELLRQTKKHRRRYGVSREQSAMLQETISDLERLSN